MRLSLNNSGLCEWHRLIVMLHWVCVFVNETCVCVWSLCLAAGSRFTWRASAACALSSSALCLLVRTRQVWALIYGSHFARIFTRARNWYRASLFVSSQDLWANEQRANAHGHIDSCLSSWSRANFIGVCLDTRTSRINKLCFVPEKVTNRQREKD